MSVRERMEEIKAWMRANAPVILESLEGPVAEQELVDLETRLGFSVPEQLRELWLMHGGTTDEVGFFGFMSFVGPNGLDNRDIMLFVRSDRDLGKDDSVEDSEIESDAWIPLAQQGYADGIALCGVSGRVFSWAKDSPAVQFRAASLEKYLEMYLTALRAGKYELQDDCYLG